MNQFYHYNLIKSISIYSINGQLITQLASPNMNTKIDVSNLESGVYIIFVETKNGSLAIRCRLSQGGLFLVRFAVRLTNKL